jgi:hypothetical protein
MFKLSIVVVLIVGARLYGEIPLAPNNYRDDDIVTLVYYPKGQLWLTHPLDDGGLDSSTAKLSTVEIVSTVDFFEQYDWCGLIDACSPRKVFKLDPAGFASLPPLKVAAGFTSQTLTQSLQVSVFFVGGRGLYEVDLHVVPEPGLSVFALVGLGLLGLRSRNLQLASNRL